MDHLRCVVERITYQNETNGYTIFYYDAAVGELKVVKDAGIGPDYDPALHIAIFEGTEDEVFDAWFAAAGIKRRPAEPMAGYTSWYNRVDKSTDETISEDLQGCSRVLEPGDLFQIDDGWQTAVGDWRVDTEKFPRGLRASVEDIHSCGFKAGLWLAPFAAQASSDLVKAHPDWLLMHRAMDLLRDWCGDGMILGCGVPLMPAFGKVEYCRIGCDASLDWENTPLMRQVNREIVSTRNAIGDTYFRRQLDGRAFLNDPDVFFLRKDNIKLTEEEKAVHARVLAQYGSFFLTSDNMGDYDEEQLSRYREYRRLWNAKDWDSRDFLSLL